MSQRKTEWLEQVDRYYHERQFREVYRSTVAFCDWLESIGYIDSASELVILDLACGSGANTYYLGQRYPRSTFIGVDLNTDLVERGNSFFRDNDVANCRLMQGDLYDLESLGLPSLDGVVCLQTLSWLPEFKKPLEAMAGLDADWIALTSLFYDGPLNCTIEVQDHDEALLPTTRSFYNVYSLPLVERFIGDVGFLDFKHVPFEIDVDLPRPSHKGRGTYTETLQDGRRLQLSGPLFMPWHFVAADRRARS